MKNALRKERGEKPNNKRAAPSSLSQKDAPLNVLIRYAVLSICTAILVFGCNDSLQKTPHWPGAAIDSDLVPEATRIISQGLADADPLIRVNAIEVVAVTERIRLMPKVQRLLKDEFVPVRFAAALAVGDLEYSLAQKQVAQLLNDQNENVRIAAAYAMSKLGSPESSDLLRNAIAGSDQTVRANAAFLLGKSGDKSALRSLWWALHSRDSDYKVKFQAVEAIAGLGDTAIFRKLWATVFSTYADDRIIGIRAMGALGTPKAREVLITKLDDDILEVRLAAAEQLGMLGSSAGEPEVLDVFAKNLTAGLDKGRLERVNVFTALAIGQIRTPRLKKFLPRLLKDESKSVRIAAAKAVFQCTMQDRHPGKPSV